MYFHIKHMHMDTRLLETAKGLKIGGISLWESSIFNLQTAILKKINPC